MFLIRETCVRFRRKCKMKLYISGTSQKKIEPVKLSYSSYESTQTSHPESVPAPLIVMHGLFGSKTNWNSLCKAIHSKSSPQCKVIAIDLRNHGDSPHSDEHTYAHLAEDVKELFEQLRIKTASLLGHSMGGRTAMLFALKYPELVDRLIVADISPVSSGTVMSRMPSIMKAMEEVSLPNNVPMSMARLNADLQLSRRVSDKSVRAYLLTNLIQRGDGSYGWRINLNAISKNFAGEIALFPDTNDLKYSGPTLFIGGGNSDFIRERDQPKILEIFPAAKFHYIEGAGHMLQSDKPTEFVKVVVDFLKKEQ